MTGVTGKFASLPLSLGKTAEIDTSRALVAGFKGTKIAGDLEYLNTSVSLDGI